MKTLQFTKLRAPEGDGGDGGSGDGGVATAPPPSDTSHAEAASALWDSPPAPVVPPAEAPPAVTPPAATAPAETAKPAVKADILGKLGKPEPAKPAEPAAVEHPEDKLSLGDKAAPATTAQFGELKKITKSLRAEIATRDARLAELEKKASVGAVASPEVERLRAEHKALSDRLAIVDLKSHPTFVNQFVEPRNKITGALTQILKDNAVEGVDLAAIAGLPRAELSKKVSEIAGKLTDFDADEFKTGMRSLMQLEAQSRDALSKAGETATALQQKTAESQRAAFDQTWTAIAGESSLYQKAEAPEGATAEQIAMIDAYNKGVDGIRAEAEKIAFGTADDKGVARAATEAATFRFIVQHAFPRMQAEYAGMIDHIKALTAEITALKGQKPDPAGGGGGVSDGGAKTLDSMSHGDAAAALWGR